MEGYRRGNRVTWDGEHWRTAAGADAMACPLTCPQCQVAMQPDAPDACLGQISGAAGGCCGHGVHVGYINWPGIPAPAGWWQRAYIAEAPP